MFRVAKTLEADPLDNVMYVGSKKAYAHVSQRVSRTMNAWASGERGTGSDNNRDDKLRHAYSTGSMLDQKYQQQRRKHRRQQHHRQERRPQRP